MKFENTEVWGFEGTMRGMRNPLESWKKSDSSFSPSIVIGENDLRLAQNLIKAGPEHRKFLRYIHVQFDITAPLYFFKEFDTYKIGTTSNSTSTMHKLATTPITMDCFEIDDYDRVAANLCKTEEETNLVPDSPKFIIHYLESLRKQYLATKDKRYWKELIRWLPESWLQTRTIDLNYEVLRTIYHQRKNHKLTEWSVQFIDWIKTLPYANEFILFEND